MERKDSRGWKKRNEICESYDRLVRSGKPKRPDAYQITTFLIKSRLNKYLKTLNDPDYPEPLKEKIRKRIDKTFDFLYSEGSGRQAEISQESVSKMYYEFSRLFKEIRNLYNDERRRGKGNRAIIERLLQTFKDELKGLPSMENATEADLRDYLQQICSGGLRAGESAMSELELATERASDSLKKRVKRYLTKL